MAKVNYFQPIGKWFPVQGNIMVISPIGAEGELGSETVHVHWANKKLEGAPSADLKNAPEFAEVSETTGLTTIQGVYCYLTDKAGGEAPDAPAEGEAQRGCYISFAD